MLIVLYIYQISMWIVLYIYRISMVVCIVHISDIVVDVYCTMYIYIDRLSMLMSGVCWVRVPVRRCDGRL